MLIHAAADQKIKFLAPPFVLEKEARTVGGLLKVTPKAEVFIVQHSTPAVSSEGRNSSLWKE